MRLLRLLLKTLLPMRLQHQRRPLLSNGLYSDMMKRTRDVRVLFYARVQVVILL